MWLLVLLAAAAEGDDAGGSTAVVEATSAAIGADVGALDDTRKTSRGRTVTPPLPLLTLPSPLASPSRRITPFAMATSTDRAERSNTVAASAIWSMLSCGAVRSRHRNPSSAATHVGGGVAWP